MHYADELTEQVREIMANTFGMGEDDLAGDVAQETCPRWSSLNHMALLVALEERYGLRFTMNEMMSMISLDKIMAVLRQHTTRVS